VKKGTQNKSEEKIVKIIVLYPCAVNRQIGGKPTLLRKLDYSSVEKTREQ
jgi:hypothetical protein